jgi:small subunit ribosomal protein S8
MTNQITLILLNIRVNNAQNKRSVCVPYSKATEAFVSILQKNGFITGYSVRFNKIAILLKYYEEVPNFSKATFYSKPGRRWCLKYKELLKYFSLNDFVILSTNVGYITLQEAYQMGIGGQVICKIY